jgi:hypothetical protein
VSGIQARLLGVSSNFAPTLFAITILVVHVGSSLQLNKSTKTVELPQITCAPHGPSFNPTTG